MAAELFFTNRWENFMPWIMVAGVPSYFLLALMRTTRSFTFSKRQWSMLVLSRFPFSCNAR